MAVQTCQFLADAERIDAEVILDPAVRSTIDHLNDKFEDYEKEENTFKELSTVGRIMALFNWLRENNIHERIELDDLLSVKIPAFSTPERTKKFLQLRPQPIPRILT